MPKGVYKGARVLVTGNTGFTGGWMSTWLHMLGAEVMGASRDKCGERNLFTQEELDSIMKTSFVEIQAHEEFERLAREFDPHIIFHLAAQPLVVQGYENPLETFQTNSFGTASVLNAALAVSSLKGVVVITTDKVYKPSESAHSEEGILHGEDPYSASKVAAEATVDGYRYLFSKQGKQIVTLRGGNIFGGGDWSPNRIIPDLFRAWQAQSTLVLRSPKATRPWQHVLDLCYGYLMVGERVLSGREGLSESYNIGPDENQYLSVEELIKLFTGIKVNLEFERGIYPESSTLSLDSSKIALDLGWQPRLSVLEAANLTSDWYVEVLCGAASPLGLTKGQIQSYGLHFE